jgi:hypothetical protein
MVAPELQIGMLSTQHRHIRRELDPAVPVFGQSSRNGTIAPSATLQSLAERKLSAFG